MAFMLILVSLTFISTLSDDLWVEIFHDLAFTPLAASNFPDIAQTPDTKKMNFFNTYYQKIWGPYRLLLIAIFRIS